MQQEQLKTIIIINVGPGPELRICKSWYTEAKNALLDIRMAGSWLQYRAHQPFLHFDVCQLTESIRSFIVVLEQNLGYAHPRWF